MTIIDTHAHLDHVENVEAALNEAAQAGVKAVLAVGVDLAANKKNLELHRRIGQPKIYLGLGIHPGNIVSSQIEETLQFIREHVGEAIAMGEIGLDFWYKWVRKSDEKKREQEEVFRTQLILAKEKNLPVTIHSRGAWLRCLAIVKDVGITRGVFHWYSGPVDVLKGILDQGFYVSCTPSLRYSEQAREAISFAPIERTLIETDCPVFYQDDSASGGFQARPKDVWKTLDLYCGLKKIDREKALPVLNQNARDLFGISIE